MYEMESLLVDDDFINRPDTYNRIKGGFNTIEMVNERMDHYRPPEDRMGWAKQGRKVANRNNAHLKGSSRHLYLLETDVEYRAAFCAAVKAGRATAGGFSGRAHTDEAKRKIGQSNSKLFKGKGNPNFGKKWMHNPLTGEAKPIAKDHIKQMLTSGWALGRIIK